METRKLDLFGDGDSQSSSTRPEDYVLRGDIQQYAKEMLDITQDLEYWSPVYQACEPLLTKYLATGSVPELTRIYLSGIYDKVDKIDVPETACTSIYTDIHLLFNTSTGELFRGLDHNAIVEFCNTAGIFFTSQKRVIWRDMHNETIMNEVMDGLLNKGTYRSLMCATILYRNQRARDFRYDTRYRDEIRGRLDRWVAEYTAEFEKVMGMLGEQNEFYIWYRPSVLSCVQRGFQQCLSESGLVFLTPEISKTEPQPVCTAINSYMNGGPLGTRPVSDRRSYAFDALYKLFFENKEGDPHRYEDCHHALCIGRSSYDTFQSYLRDFYLGVEKGELGTWLLNRIIAMQGNENVPMTEEEYRASLIVRGFPLNQQN